MDQASGPAGKIAASLASIEAKINALKSAGDPTGGMGAGLEGAGGSAMKTGLAMGFASEAARRLTDMVIGLAGAMKDLVIDSAKMALEAVDFRDNAELAFNALAKSHGYAESSAKLFDDAMKLAAATPFKADMIVSQYQKLMAAGFKPIEIPVLLGGASDLAAGTGKGAEKVDQLVGSLMRLKSEGKLSGEVLRSFTEGGVDKLALIDVLSKDLGKTPAMIKQMLEAGTISADEGSFAIMQVIHKNLSGGDIGELTAKKSQTMSGLWSTLQSSALMFLSKIDVTPVKNALKTLAGYLDLSSDKGKALKATLESFFGGMFGKLGEVLSPANMAAGFDTALTVIRQIKTALDEAWPVLKAFGKGAWDGVKDAVAPLKKLFATFDADPSGAHDWAKTMGALGEALGVLVVVTAAVGAAFGWFVGELITEAGELGDMMGTAAYDLGHGFDEAVLWIEKLPDRMLGLGSDIVDGLWSGIKAGWATMLSGFSALVDLLPASVKSALRIASPSRVFAELGVYTAQGFQQGIEGETNNTRGSMIAMVDPGLMRGARGQGQAASSTTANSITIEINGAKDAKDVAREVVDHLTSTIAMFEGMALESGALGASPSP